MERAGVGESIWGRVQGTEPRRGYNENRAVPWGQSPMWVRLECRIFAWLVEPHGLDLICALWLLLKRQATNRAGVQGRSGWA